MKNILDDVAEFHLACGVPISGTLAIPSLDIVDMRIRLIEEEVNAELIPALKNGDLVGIADGIADAIYVLAGAALAYGIPLEAVWDTVQRANMAKVDPVTGQVRRREDGKILKPEGWKPPDIAGVLSL